MWKKIKQALLKRRLVARKDENGNLWVLVREPYKRSYVWMRACVNPPHDIGQQLRRGLYGHLG